MKRLMTAQGVLTLLGLVTGLTGIFVPFGVGPFLELRVLDAFTVPFDLDSLAVAPLVFPVLICAIYLQWLIKGRLAAWVWRTGYALAVLGGVGLLLWFGFVVFQVFFDYWGLGLALCGFTALGAGAWWVRRNRRVGIPHALSALIALQVVYVASGLVIGLLVTGSGIPDPSWGALFIFLTGVVYVVQMVLGSRQRRARV